MFFSLGHTVLYISSTGLIVSLWRIITIIIGYPGFRAWFRLLYMLIFSTTTSRAGRIGSSFSSLLETGHSSFKFSLTKGQRLLHPHVIGFHRYQIFFLLPECVRDGHCFLLFISPTVIFAVVEILTYPYGITIRQCYLG